MAQGFETKQEILRHKRAVKEALAMESKQVEAQSDKWLQRQANSLRKRGWIKTANFLDWVVKQPATAIMLGVVAVCGLLALWVILKWIF